MATEQNTTDEALSASSVDASPNGNPPGGEEQQPAKPKRKRRWLRILLWVVAIGLVGLVLLVALLPTIISSGPVTKRIAASASDYLDRDVSIGDLAFGWRSGLKVTDLAVVERDGAPFASFRSLSCDLGIMALLGRRIVVRDLSLVDPKLVVRRDKEGRLSIDDLLSPKEPRGPERKSPTTRGPVKLPDTSIRAEVVNGTFEFEDQRSGETVSFREFNAALAVPSINEPITLSVGLDLVQGGRTEAVSLKADARVAENNRLLVDQATASLDFNSVPVQATVKLDMSKFNGAPDAKGAEFTLNCNLAELMERIGPIVGLPKGMQVAGTIQSQMAATGDLEDSIGLKGTTVVSGLAIAGGPLADMPVRQDTVRNVLDLSIAMKEQRPDSVAITSFTVDAPALKLDASGNASDLGDRGDLQGTVTASADLTEIAGIVSGLLPPELRLGGHARMTMAATTSLKALSDAGASAPAEGAATPNPFASLGAVAADGSIEVDHVEYTSKDTQLVLSDMRLQPIKLADGVLTANGRFTANDGPGTLEARIDLNDPEPTFDTTIKAKDIALSQRVSLLGYIIPLLILPADGQIQSSASFTATAHGKGLAWETLREKLKASGSLELGKGTISGGEILGAILKLTGQRDQFQFNGMSTKFGLADGKITSDAIQVNSAALSFALQGWTSIVPDPETGGYAMEYRPGPEILKRYAGSEYERIAALLGKQGEGYSPLVIAGLVQKPKVKLNLPGIGDAAKGLIGGALGDVLGGKKGKGEGEDEGGKKKDVAEGAAGLLKGLLK
jgi:uncharacterized protein involved in outer membrane biogenesis